jgi:hypothetical protein
MLAFVSIFLGLVSGVRPVELAVGKDVAAVEIRLDGRTLARLRGEPWQLDVDFGATPEPHHLEATGFDASGVEIARTMQRINLQRSLAEASLLLEPGPGGKGRFARLTWQSAIAERPERVIVTFDGFPVSAPDPARIPLPAFVPERLHFLRAELEFPGHTSASAEITFGGLNRDQTQAELTAVPVLSERKKLPPEKEMDGWFLANGAPLKVVASEEGSGEISVVLDEAARGALAKLVESYRPTRVAPGTIPFNWARLAAPLKSGQRARFQWTFPEVHEHSGTRFEVFPRTEDFSQSDAGFLWLMTHVFPPGVPEVRRFADAVAVAGLDVSARSHPRAVVLLLAGSRDASRLSAAGARNFLACLRVPLFVWTVGAGAAEATAWGTAADATDVSTPAAFEDATRRLAALVDRQRIVWVEGVHLPQSISLSERASGVTLAR